MKHRQTTPPTQKKKQKNKQKQKRHSKVGNECSYCLAAGIKCCQETEDNLSDLLESSLAVKSREKDFSISLFRRSFSRRILRGAPTKLLESFTTLQCATRLGVRSEMRVSRNTRH